MTPTVIEDFDVLRQLTQGSDAIWLSSRYAMMPELREGSLRILPIALPPPSVLQMVMHSLGRRSNSPATSELKHALRGQIRALAKAEALLIR